MSYAIKVRTASVHDLWRAFSTSLAVAENAAENLERLHSDEQCFLPRFDSCNPFFEVFAVNPASGYDFIWEISTAVTTITYGLASSL